MESNQKRLISTAKVCARYGRVSRTIDRWIESGEIPKPIYIHKLRYWDEAELDRFDDARRQVAS
jgi:predicted DNA-binding transcriptional regulator AlpA